MSNDDLIRRGDALAVLRKAQVASCTCQIKTPDPEWHSHNCRYRILREAEAMIDHVPAFETIPATDARADALREAAAISEFEDDKYLILKRGMYYRPDRNGYTSSPSEAGRYTLAQAVFLTHPNGLDGPRDGMSFVPLSALIGETRT